MSLDDLSLDMHEAINAAARNSGYLFRYPDGWHGTRDDDTWTGIRTIRALVRRNILEWDPWWGWEECDVHDSEAEDVGRARLTKGYLKKMFENRYIITTHEDGSIMLRRESWQKLRKGGGYMQLAQAREVAVKELYEAAEAVFKTMLDEVAMTLSNRGDAEAIHRLGQALYGRKDPRVPKAMRLQR